jgi:hypothetical protein
MLSRREVFPLGLAPLGLAPLGLSLLSIPAFGKTEFWNAKTPDKWSSEEIEKLTTDSPWARAVNAEFQQDADYATDRKSRPTIGRGGNIGAPESAANAPQFEIGPGAERNGGGARRREPVTVRWESGQPIRDALGFPLPGDFADRYVIAVTALPYGVMEKPKRGQEGPVEPETPIARQRRMMLLLQQAATLEARGKEPAQPGLVRPAPKALATWLFGFSKEFLTIDGTDRDVEFTLRTAFVSLRAKFDPKMMLYRGKLAV